MTRQTLTRIVSVVLLAALGVWVSRNTYWGEIKIPAPPTGEAATNPFYVAQRFTEALGARALRDRALVVPPPDAVIVLAAWHWSLTDERRLALERWVESGGRLVIDSTLTGGESEFETWSGIVREYFDEDDPDELTAVTECVEVEEQPPAEGPATPPHRLCHFDGFSYFTTDRPVEWSLHRGKAPMAMRVAIGRGSVTAINADPFRRLAMFDGDHGWVFVSATQLRRGDEVHFLAEDDRPKLLALLWQNFWPAVSLFLVCVAIVLVRGSVRIGPLAAPPARGRRSLAEQILGSGQFAVRQGDGEALLGAATRALEEAARRRIIGYTALTIKDRAAAIARLTGFDQKALAKALFGGTGRSTVLRNTIALLESARRQLLDRHPGNPHGTS